MLRAAGWERSCCAPFLSWVLHWRPLPPLLKPVEDYSHALSSAPVCSSLPWVRLRACGCSYGHGFLANDLPSTILLLHTSPREALPPWHRKSESSTSLGVSSDGCWTWSGSRFLLVLLLPHAKVQSPATSQQPWSPARQGHLHKDVLPAKFSGNPCCHPGSPPHREVLGQGDGCHWAGLLGSCICATPEVDKAFQTVWGHSWGLLLTLFLLLSGQPPHMTEGLSGVQQAPAAGVADPPTCPREPGLEGRFGCRISQHRVREAA